MQRLVFAEDGSKDARRLIRGTPTLTLRPVAWAIKAATMDEDRPTQAPALPCRQCAALQAELAAVKAERDFLRDELRERRECAARLMSALERRQREAHDREDDSEPGRGTLQ